MSLLNPSTIIQAAYDEATQTIKTTDSGTAAAYVAASESLRVTLPQMWSVNHTPASATQATISKAAGGTGVQHICTGIIATIAAGGTAQTPITLRLRDGATGAGTVLLSMTLSTPANGVAGIALTNLSIPGTANTAMTLEFSGAGATDTVQSVNLIGYDI